MASKQTKNNFEEKMKRLEEIVSQMESGDIDIEQSIALFEEGVKLSGECRQWLDKAETKVKKLIDDSLKEAGAAGEEDFKEE